MLPSVRHAVRCVWAHPMQIQRVVIARWFRAPRRGAVAWPPNLSVVFGLMLASNFPIRLRLSRRHVLKVPVRRIIQLHAVLVSLHKHWGEQIERCHPRRR